MAGKLRFIGCLLLVFLVMLGIAALIARRYIQTVTVLSKGEPFQSARWKANPDHRDMITARSMMSKDLETHYLTKGMTKAQVVDLIGPPAKSLQSKAKSQIQLGKRKPEEFAQIDLYPLATTIDDDTGKELELDLYVGYDNDGKLLDAWRSGE